MFLITTLVDIFDVYEKLKILVDKKHLEVRMNALKLGTFKTSCKNCLGFLEND